MSTVAGLVVFVGRGKRTHEIRGRFLPARTDNVTKCGKHNITRARYMKPGNPLAVTCEPCQKAT